MNKIQFTVCMNCPYVTRSESVFFKRVKGINALSKCTINGQFIFQQPHCPITLAEQPVDSKNPKCNCKWCFTKQQPIPTPKMIYDFTKNALSRRYVSDEETKQRTEICKNCDKVRNDPQHGIWCTVCGCSLQGQKIMNLARYEETAKKLRCKHPQRKQGKGWPLPILKETQ